MTRGRGLPVQPLSGRPFRTPILRRFLTSVAAVLLGLTFLFARPVLAQETDADIVRIGILAHRGWAEQEAAWTPLADYLQARLDGRIVRLVPVTLTSAGPLVNAGGLDFLVTNPGHYIALSETYPMSVLATRKRLLTDGSHAMQFGSAILVRADSGLGTLAELRDARLGAVAPEAFGGFEVAWYEARAQGIDLLSDTEETVFLGFPQDAIVQAVLDGRIDAGIVRSGLLERLQAEGAVETGALRVLNANVTYTYPEAVSTRLYPEWPFVALAGTPAALRDAVALALLQSTESDMADLWGAPVSYHDARVLVAAFHARTAEDRSGATALSVPMWILAILAAAIVLLAAVLFMRTARRAPNGPLADAEPPAEEIPLTRREAQVLKQIRQGHSTKEIAAALGISPKTVEFHRTNLLRKFDARSSAQLIARAQRQFSGPETET